MGIISGQFGNHFGGGCHFAGCTDHLSSSCSLMSMIALIQQKIAFHCVQLDPSREDPNQSWLSLSFESQILERRF